MPSFFPYKDARVYGFDFLMRAEPDRIFACLACASGFGDEKVRVIWDAARGFFSESVMESHLRATFFASKFSLRQMRDDLVLSDGGEGYREDCPEKDHPVMKILSRLVREQVRECLADLDYSWGERSGLGWADLTDQVRALLATEGSEVIWELTLAEDLGL
ncbi:hypothetical protein EKG40_08235 [Pseudomonas moorei]|nr:hypothetical protein EKG40_08235 [Pseudomonas moorei]